MGHLYRQTKSPYWWADYRSRTGERVRKSTGCSDRVAARNWLVERERAETTPPDLSTSEQTVEDAIVELEATTEWKPRTRRSNHCRCATLVELLGDRRLDLLLTEDIEGYIQSRRDSDITDHTIGKELCILRQALRLAVLRRWIRHEIPLPRHRPRYRPRERYLERAEYERLRERVPSQWRTWLDVACWLGTRRGETDALDWSDVDLERGLVRVRGTKTGGSDRTIGLPDGLRERLPPARTSGPVARRWVSVLRDLALACEAAHLPPATPNDLRRTCATWLCDAGVSAEDCARWLGHASLDMVMRVYAKRTPSAMIRAAAKMGG